MFGRPIGYGRVFVVRLLDVAEIDADILLRDDVGDLEQLGVAARVIVVLVRVDDVDDRLVRHRRYFRDHVVRVPVEHVIHQDHARASHVNGHIAAFPRDHVEVALHALDVHRLRRLQHLRMGRGYHWHHGSGKREQ